MQVYNSQKKNVSSSGSNNILTKLTIPVSFDDFNNRIISQQFTNDSDNPIPNGKTVIIKDVKAFVNFDTPLDVQLLHCSIEARLKFGRPNIFKTHEANINPYHFPNRFNLLPVHYENNGGSEFTDFYFKIETQELQPPHKSPTMGEGVLTAYIIYEIIDINEFKLPNFQNI